MINVRQEHILKTLLRESKGMTIEGLSIKFGVSARTVREDLKSIDMFLDKNGKSIKHNNLEKIYYIKHDDRKEIEKYFSKYELNSDWRAVEANQRELYILFLLILNNKTYITTEQIADELYISKTAIANDVKKVSKWISKVVNKKIKTSKANGILVDLTELEIRMLMSSAIYRNYSTDSKYCMNLIKHLTDELGNVDRFILFNEIFLDYLSKNNIILDYEGSITFVLELILFVYRIGEGYLIEFNIENSNTYYDFPFESIEEITGITLPQNEREFIKGVLELKECISTPRRIMVNQSIEKICSEYINILTKEFNIYFDNFSEDLYNKWKKHLEVSLYKKKLAYTEDEYVFCKSKEAYKKFYTVLKPLGEIVYEHTNEKLEEDDYMYNSIYLELMGISYKSKVNVIVTSRYKDVLLMSINKQLKDLFCNKINVLDCCAINQLDLLKKKYKEESIRVDFIIATHAVKTESDTPIEYVSLPLTNDDIIRVNSYF